MKELYVYLETRIWFQDWENCRDQRRPAGCEYVKGYHKHLHGTDIGFFVGLHESTSF